MAEKKELVKRAVRKAVQKMLRAEASEWPPDCTVRFYQPRRPQEPLAELAPDKSKMVR